jgi:hypothetical protein
MKSLQDRIEKLEEAKEMLRGAISLVEEAAEDTKMEPYTKAYLMGHLKIAESNDRSSLSTDLNLAEVMLKLTEEK